LLRLLHAGAAAEPTEGKPIMNHADPNRSEALAANVAIALRFKKSQGTPAMPQVEKEVLAANYDRARGGNLHLANNAREQGWAHPGMYLRSAFPDRVDVIEQVIADGDRVGLLFRVTATHTGEFFGIAPTGRRIDVYEIAWLRIRDGQMVEGWFMMDETALLKQLGVKLPPRADGKIVAPPVAAGGEEIEAVVQQLSALQTPLARNKIVVAQSRASHAGDGRAPEHQSLRNGFHHTREYSIAGGHGALALDTAIPDRHDRVEAMMAEGGMVWLRFNTGGTHSGNGLAGLAPTGRRVGINVAMIARFDGGRWVESWTFADELGVLLQLGQPDLLL
jgi:predicted ester cyclase